MVTNDRPRHWLDRLEMTTMVAKRNLHITVNLNIIIAIDCQAATVRKRCST
jgi:hypothetical protein